ncbi:MAG: phospholipid carrier-dependent glycosyltransferase, partial [Actinomycetota bacterium]
METEPAAAPRPFFLRADFVLGTAVTVFAAVLRFIRLDIPKKLIPLDEAYYPANALGLLRHGADFGLMKDGMLPGNCSEIPIEPVFAVHPPVGKWLIGAGMRVFGCNSFGWRVGGALFGSLCVLLVFLIGRRLFRSAWTAGLGALLVAVDGLHFVQSRVAMLDIFLAFFVVLAIWLLVEDRTRTSTTHQGWRLWRVGSAAAIGLATATKWSAAFLIPILVILALVWELERRKRARAERAAMLASIEQATAGVVLAEEEPAAEDDLNELTRTESYEFEPELEADPEPTALGDEWLDPSSAPRLPEPLWRQLLRLAITFAVLPVFIYVATYVPWFAAGKDRYTAPRCAGPTIEFKGLVNPVDSRFWNSRIWPRNWKEWVCYQREIYEFHKNLKPINAEGKPSHPYLARAWSWPWMGRPASHFFESKGQDPPCDQKPGVRDAAGRIEAARVQAQTSPGQTTASPSPSPTGTGSATGTGTATPAPAPADPTKPCKTHAEILGLPNPGLWFPAFFIALPLCVWWALRRRDEVSAMLLLLFAPLYMPWLITTRPLFLFYMTPAVPILALMVAHFVERSLDTLKPLQQVIAFSLLFTSPFTPLYIQWIHSGRTIDLLYKAPALAVLLMVGAGLAALIVTSPKPRRLGLAYAGLVIAMFGYFYPVLSASYIPDAGALGWRKHMWLQRDCGGDRIRLTCWI